MKLLLDMGNRRIKWALADGNVLRERLHFLPVPHGDAADCFELAWGELRPAAVAFCSVSPGEASRNLHEWVRHRWQLDAIEVRSRDRCGPLINGYREPERLGADRWANLHGARALLGAVDTVIVDAGTAVTVDALGADGRHLGGAILAGLNAGRAGLGSAAPALPAAGESTLLPAVDTATAIAGGTLLGLAGAIERVAAEVARELEQPARLLTGGDADALHGSLGSQWRYDELLTLRGVNAVSEEMVCAGSH